jgi:mono/diheme cytochrome c family protein
VLGNLLSFLALIALLVLFGWLTLRAWRIQRLLYKIPALLFGGLLSLIFLVVVFVAGKGLAFAYIAPDPAPDLTVAGSSDQVARGEYLVSVACVGCHGADGGGEFPLTGGMDFAEEIPMPIGSMQAANITPGGILAERTDGELFRDLRYGFSPEGRLGMMTFMPYRQLSDEDTQAIIAFLRSQEPVTTASNGGDKVNLLGAILFFGAGLVPLPEQVTGVISAPPQGMTAEYGKYVATFGECRGCHGPDMIGAPATALTTAVPNPRPFVGLITLEEFVQTMRTGKRPNGTELQMPWRNASQMTDEDLGALYVYLTTAP